MRVMMLMLRGQRDARQRHAAAARSLMRARSAQEARRARRIYRVCLIIDMFAADVYGAIRYCFTREEMMLAARCLCDTGCHERVISAYAGAMLRLRRRRA